VDWVQLAHDTDHWQNLVNIVTNFRIPKPENSLTIYVTIIFSRRILLHELTSLVYGLRN
jgi:hypothetical protein